MDAVAPPGDAASTFPIGRSDKSPAAVRLSAVTKAFGPVVAVRSVDFDFAKGSLTSLLGPSGCGKTTLLRLIAGLEAPTAGSIEINGRSVDRVPIHRRNIGFVFQNYALFPHRTVFQNVGFGLKHRGVDAKSAAAKVRRALAMVRLPGMEDRYPNQISGGQQQRVALARAVVFEPDVLLLDEPLSALDANLRDQMRVEIKLIQKELGLTTILVTHDQHEALAMSDEVILMKDGVVQQTGTPASVYRHPRNRFVASFLGQANVLEGHVDRRVAAGTEVRQRVRLANDALVTGIVARGGSDSGREPAEGEVVDVVIRAARVMLRSPSAGRDDGTSGNVNRFQGVIEDVGYLGDTAVYQVDLAGLKIRASKQIDDGIEADAPILTPGAAVVVEVPPDACTILPRTGEPNEGRK